MQPTRPAAMAKVANSRKPLTTSKRSNAPKLKGGVSRAPDSSTDDVEEAEAWAARAKRPTKTRRSPCKDREVSNNSKVGKGPAQNLCHFDDVYTGGWSLF